jgi:hypothetical protein
MPPFEIAERRLLALGSRRRLALGGPRPCIPAHQFVADPRDAEETGWTHHPKVEPGRHFVLSNRRRSAPDAYLGAEEFRARRRWDGAAHD